MAKNAREEMLQLFSRGGPRTRKTTARHIEGKVDQDGAAFVQEQLSFVEPDMTVRQVDFISSRTGGWDTGDAGDTAAEPGCAVQERRNQHRHHQERTLCHERHEP